LGPEIHDVGLVHPDEVLAFEVRAAMRKHVAGISDWLTRLDRSKRSLEEELKTLEP